MAEQNNLSDDELNTVSGGDGVDDVAAAAANANEAVNQAVNSSSGDKSVEKPPA